MENRKNAPLVLFTVLFLALIAILLWKTGFFAAASTVEGMQGYIERFSPYSQLVFFLIQLASVILAPIPSNLSAVAGGILFGIWQAFLLTILAVFLGSAVVFLLARRLGRSFTEQFISERASGKYMELIKTKRDTFLGLALLLPFFPDDLLCILAGLTDISFRRYMIIVVLTRPWGLLVASALGGSVVTIPLPGMIAIGVAGAVIFILGLKYGDRIEEKIMFRIKRKET